MLRKSAIFLILLILLLPVATSGYDEVLVLDRTPFAYSRMFITTAAVSQLNATYRAQAGAVFLTVESNNVRYRIDGGNPDALNGHLLVAAGYQNLWLSDPHAIDNLRMIGSGGNAIVVVTFYREN